MTVQQGRAIALLQRLNLTKAPPDTSQQRGRALRLEPEAPPLPEQLPGRRQRARARLGSPQDSVGVGALVRECGDAGRRSGALQRRARRPPRQQAAAACQRALTQVIC